MHCNVYLKKLAGDTQTPVGLLLKLRKAFGNVHLMESSIYNSKRNSKSFLCFNSLSHVSVHGGVFTQDGIDKPADDVPAYMRDYIKSFTFSSAREDWKQFSGLVGYSAYSAVQYFEKISFDQDKVVEHIPDLRYDFFRNIIVIDHYYDTMWILDHCPDGADSNIENVESCINTYHPDTEPFKTIGEEYSNMLDSDFIEMVRHGKAHCQRGDVFQIVLSRKFYTPYEGDDVNLYRALRRVNPSPYLFYFDYGDYRIFGSSPEAQLVIKDGVAEIHPIAGTFRRTGDIAKDAELAEELSNDPKEVSEHVMLVDLARNDLSRNTTQVKVDKYKEVQYFSHVIHLVSKVTGQLEDRDKNFQVFADTFPAGTLSGAPKVSAMQLIDRYEPQGRSFYGGGIGLIHFNGDLNHAIIIRSFLSKNKLLIRQAGAGIVIKSEEDKELQEVNNKLAALKAAIALAEEM